MEAGMVTVDNRDLHPLVDRLATHWWLGLIRGIAAIAFGLFALAFPGSAVIILLLLFGIYAFCDGVVALTMAFAGTDDATPTWWLVVTGALGMIAGIAAFGWPELTSKLLLIIMGTWAFLAGIAQIAGAIELRKELQDEWLLLASGIATVIIGLVAIAFPGAAITAVAWAASAYALVFGGLWTALAFRLRRLRG
jgi:uncharacterized membrane protein HdeD (DUF308 family)